MDHQHWQKNITKQQKNHYFVYGTVPGTLMCLKKKNAQFWKPQKGNLSYYYKFKFNLNF